MYNVHITTLLNIHTPGYKLKQNIYGFLARNNY